MSQSPDSSSNSSSNTEFIRTMRLARQASHDVLRSRHQLHLPSPMSVSKSTRLTSSRSRMSDSSGDDELETPNSVPRFSISSSSSTQTTLSTPRSSLPSVHEKQQQSGSLWIGQRVFVESIRLKGTLRFLGTTQFKSGVWAGIELDHAGSGKNDGSVDR
ncbi:CAP Gly-rich domain-containing protein [Zychaea mexicana]|uniref:CAP Gly-rich domain-containing protein n=1 Tax=Zychaea mexicana TaxID=64656 RepID=UPI0022FE1C59|nr:CAP Gly-rich domain-containing protein [Zychaea mexicana]KAI9493163.1 CAP Gly-rich domain-containing protein [Zychaea mexicana]